MEKVSYQEAREDIKTGDLLVWKRDKNSNISNMFLSTVRIFTVSEFAHVAIAVKAFNRLFVIEATIPCVRIFPVSNYDEFYHIPMELEVADDALEYLLEKVGMPYSIGDAIRAYLGKTVDSNTKWQCAELANRFYKKAGRDYGDNWTPTNLVNAILEEGRTIRLIKITR